MIKLKVSGTKEYHYSLFQKEIAEQNAKANLKTFVADKGNFLDRYL